MTDDRAIRTTIVLFDPDIEIVDRADTNDAGRSATIRKIIREWNDMRKAFAAAQAPARTLVDAGVEYRVKE